MGKCKEKRKKKKTAIWVALAIFLALCIFVIWDQWNLTVTQYEIRTEKLDTPVRIVQLSDLHNKEFGQDHAALIEKVQALSPDIIAVTGDMNADDSDQEQVVFALLEKLVHLAPVYYSLGNHEYKLDNLEDFIEKIKATGTVFLDNAMVDYHVGAQTITIGGMSEYPFYDGYAPDYDNDQRHFLDAFTQKENFKLLLCHFPEHYIWRYQEYDIDLMLSGHTHGGVVRIPFLGGMIAPNQSGLFPEYDDGMHSSDSATILISKGLGSNFWWLPRINNPPEITVADLVPAE